MSTRNYGTTRVWCWCICMCTIVLLLSTPAAADMNKLARAMAERRAQLGDKFEVQSEDTATLWLELRQRRIERARAKMEGRPYEEKPLSQLTLTPRMPDDIADAAMHVATTTWPDDFVVPKPILKHLHTLEDVDNDHAAWSMAQEDKESHQALDDWEEQVRMLKQDDAKALRVPRDQRILARGAVAATGPMVQVRNECSTLLWFVAMPARPPASGALRRQWVQRVRHLRVAIASAATHRARLVPVVVFVSAETGSAHKSYRHFVRTDPVMAYLHTWLTSRHVTMVDWQLHIREALHAGVRGDKYEWQYVHRAFNLLPMDLPMLAAEVSAMHLKETDQTLDTTRYLYTDAAVMFRAGVDSCSFNTSSDAQIIVGSGLDPWAPSAGSMLLITDHAARILWAPLAALGAEQGWRIRGGFEELLWLFFLQQRNASNPILPSTGLMPPTTNFKGFWLKKSAPTVGVVHFWGPKPLGCLPCLVGEDLGRPTTTWKCPAMPQHCKTRPMQLVQKLIGKGMSDGVTAQFLREWHVWDSNISRDVATTNVTEARTLH